MTRVDQSFRTSSRPTVQGPLSLLHACPHVLSHGLVKPPTYVDPILDDECVTHVQTDVLVCRMSLSGVPEKLQQPYDAVSLATT